jgi:hypothetical protein
MEAVKSDTYFSQNETELCLKADFITCSINAHRLGVGVTKLLFEPIPKASSFEARTIGA